MAGITVPENVNKMSRKFYLLQIRTRVTLLREVRMFMTNLILTWQLLWLRMSPAFKSLLCVSWYHVWHGYWIYQRFYVYHFNLFTKVTTVFYNSQVRHLYL